MIECPSCRRQNAEDARFCSGCGSPLARQARERRVLATVLFCDLVGSTALGERADPEVVRELMFQYFHQVRSAIELHGGTVEKFAGDAVMAVFGVPVAHEDDALRACRAALEMQRRLLELGPELEERYGTRLAARIGINTGEVVAAAGDDTFVTGDAVNVAARLEQAAAAGEVIVGETTFQLVQHSVGADPQPSVRAKGKAEPVTAFRLLEVRDAQAPRPRATAFVGREQQLRALEDAFDRASGERRCRIVTVVGEPGVGKSRLVEEAEPRLAGRGRILRGRCLSYGEGITFWPLIEIVRAAGGIRDEDSAVEARAKLARLAEPEIAGRVTALVGLGGTVAPEEVAWAVRRFVSQLAERRPLVLVVEDLHWAEPTLLDVLGGLEGAHAPVFVLVTARPDLLEARPDWHGVVRLEPLDDRQAETLLRELLGSQPSSELVRRAGGNPLFVHELAALLREHGDTAVVPTTLSALLAARLDRLPPGERDAVERASVEGEVFHRGAVATLSRTDVRAASERLQALVERELAFPAEAKFVDEAAFRFRHILVRDAAYNRLVKRLRADLHVRYADWLEAKGGDRLAEVEEIVGFHLERACQYREELSMPRETIAERASARLFAAGARAADRGDVPAGLNLLQRAVDLTAHDGRARAERLLPLARMLFLAGHLDRVGPTYAEAEQLAAESGDERLVAFARLESWRDPKRDEEELLAVAEATLPVFEATGDDLGLSKAWGAVADYHWSRSHIARSREAFELSLAHARRADEREQEAIALARLSGALRFGPYEVDEAIERMERELADPAVAPHPRAVWTAFLGALEARRGNLVRARELCRSAEELAAEIGDELAAYWVLDAALEVELLARDLIAAERVVDEIGQRAGRLGTGWLTGWRLAAAGLLVEQARLDEAERQLDLVEVVDELDAAAADVVRARIVSRRGEHDEAERLARGAVEVFDAVDAYRPRAEAYRLLGEVLSAGGRSEEARAALTRALEVDNRLGATAPADRTRALLAEAP